MAPQLPLGQLGLLSDALQKGGRVAITYRAASGAVTQRVIRDPELVGSLIEAWCELRQDERMFTPSRLLSVAPTS
jgi:predicted DNA-binding transcriptional regulator YafY